MILVVAIGCCGILIIFLLLRSHSPETSQSASEKEGEEKVSKEPPVTMTQARIKGWGRGKLSWSMETEKMKLDKQNTQALCRDGVEIRVFRDNGEINATLTSRAASINLDEKEFQLNDRVEVVSDTGDRILRTSSNVLVLSVILILKNRNFTLSSRENSALDRRNERDRSEKKTDERSHRGNVSQKNLGQTEEKKYSGVRLSSG
ncbi:MAG: LPS export ABC transporter periplasmic protein LptC [Candidatus Atribacteria bacterium]|nr:LPS export ABC transporter periplasmic protein LptC [Candidatus Atribacteria bacterium]